MGNSMHFNRMGQDMSKVTTSIHMRKVNPISKTAQTGSKNTSIDRKKVDDKNLQPYSKIVTHKNQKSFTTKVSSHNTPRQKHVVYSVDGNPESIADSASKNHGSLKAI